MSVCFVVDFEPHVPMIISIGLNQLLVSSQDKRQEPVDVPVDVPPVSRDYTFRITPVSRPYHVPLSSCTDPFRVMNPVDIIYHPYITCFLP